jgi:hypothetical protein
VTTEPLHTRALQDLLRQAQQSGTLGLPRWGTFRKLPWAHGFYYTALDFRTRSGRTTPLQHALLKTDPAVRFIRIHTPGGWGPWTRVE